MGMLNEKKSRWVTKWVGESWWQAFCYGKDLSLTAHLELSSIDVTMFKLMIKDDCVSTCM
jgi:hypothetical protein